MRIGTPLVIFAWLFATSAVVAAPVEDHSSSSTDLSSTSVLSSATSAALSSVPSSSGAESVSNSTSESSLAPESSSATSALSSTASSASPTSSASLTSSALSSPPSPSGNSSCGPVPINTLANSDDAIPFQYIVSLKPSSDVQQHFSKVQTAMAKDLECHDPGAPTNTSLNTTNVIQIPQGEAIYWGVFSDRDVAFIQSTSEFQSISRDMKAVESRKRAIGQSWNLARLATPDKLQPGSNGQGASDTSSDWNVNFKDNLGQGVFFIYVIDTGVDGNHPLLTPRVQRGNAVDGGAGNVEGDGHGTEVAGAAAATNFGVASAATIIPIKIFQTSEQGDLTDLINGITEATSDFKLKKALNPNAAAVINMSIESPNDPELQEEVAYALTLDMHVVIAAGNNARDRSDDWITNRANQNVQAAINVGAIDIGDNLATFPSPTAPGSNFGACVDVYAGGYNILTSGPKQDTSKLAFGTSLAAPQVAGIIAGVISTSGNKAPADMKAYILSMGATDKITGLSGTSNNLIAQFPSDFLA